MSSKRLLLSVGLLSVAVVLSGCIASRGGMLQAPSKWPPDPGPEKKSIRVIVTGRISSGDSEKNWSENIRNRWEMATQKAYVESSLFSSVSVSGETADLRAQVDIIEKGSQTQAFISGFICGFTMFIIPGYTSANLVMETTINDKTGQKVGVIRKEESFSFWMELFLLFAMPFHDGPDKVFQAIQSDMNQTTLEEARAKGFI